MLNLLVKLLKFGCERDCQIKNPRISPNTIVARIKERMLLKRISIFDNSVAGSAQGLSYFNTVLRGRQTKLAIKSARLILVLTGFKAMNIISGYSQTIARIPLKEWHGTMASCPKNAPHV